MIKICNKCKAEKSVEDDYYPTPNGNPRNTCKECIKSRTNSNYKSARKKPLLSLEQAKINDKQSKRKWLEEHREEANLASKLRKRIVRVENKKIKEQLELASRSPNYGKVKICTSCDKEKELDQFDKHKSGKFGVRSCCKICNSLKWSKLSPEQVEKNRLRAIKYRVDNLQACKERAVRHANKRRCLIGDQTYSKQEWDWLIKETGYKCLKCESEDKITVDHVLPITKFGSNHIDNLQPLCLSCNQKKNNKFIEYRPSDLIEKIKQKVWLGQEGNLFHT